MPIRINLLAEAQALEEIRRRDPVKRAIWIGAVLGGLLVVWSVFLQTKAISVKREVTRLDEKVQRNNREYHQVVDNQKKLIEADRKLNALHSLATNRFLNGPVLNALQRTTVDDVQLIHLKIEHLYVAVEETKAKTNAAGRSIPAKPPAMTEKITLTMEAKDTTGPDGKQAIKFKEAIADCSYFVTALGKTNEVKLDNISQPLTGPDNRFYRQFTLVCRYPEKTR